MPRKPGEAGHLLCSAFPGEKNDFQLETFFLLLNNAGLGDGMILSKCSCFPFLLVQLILRVFVLRVLLKLLTTLWRYPKAVFVGDTVQSLTFVG